MKKTRCKNAIISKMAAIVLGVLVFSNVAVMGAQAAFPEDSFTLAIVTGDGVALRSAPSTSSTRLELMYKDETVHVDINYNDVNGWSRVRRIEKTRTVGYAASRYIEEIM